MKSSLLKKEIHARRPHVLAWLLIVSIFLVTYYLHKDWFDITQLRGLVEEHAILVRGIYLLILSLIGLTFIPSTPFAIGGVLLFSPVEAYILNLVGILTSSTIVYHFARYLRLDHMFEDKYPTQINSLKKALKNKELPIIIGWSFFPAVPTDLIIYVSSTLRVHLWKALLGVLIGEGVLNAFYIFSAGRLSMEIL